MNAINQKQLRRRVVLWLTVLCLLSTVAYGRQAAKNGKKEFVFTGKVESIDQKAKTLLVTNDGIPGWSFLTTTACTVDKPEVLRTVTPGDRVTAKVYEGDSKVLYHLRVVPPDDIPVFLGRKELKSIRTRISEPSACS
ncbi:MAG: hypothetical protein C5B58_16080 [Acidobacteria bacterium]|nr:MAG: hypothetical protein C5B58_16080 [Acidobacteriota bacterium]